MPFGNSADTSRAAVDIVRESTFAVTPATPAMDALRNTGETLKTNTTIGRENEVRGDRQPGAATREDRSTGGDTSHLMSYAALDLPLEAALFSAAWTTLQAIATADVTLTMGTLTTAPSAVGIIGAGDGAFTAISDGDVVLISGWTVNPLVNNGLFRVTVESSNPGTVDDDELRLVGLTTAVIEANPGGSGIDITIPSYAENGITCYSHTIRRRYTDIAKVAVFRGMAVDGMAMTVNAKGNLETNFTWLGQSESSTDISGATVVAAPTAKVYSGVDNIQGVLENGEVVQLSEFSLNLANGLRQRNVFGVLGPNDLGVSTLALSGSFQFFYNAGREAIYDRYLDFTGSQIGVVAADASGQGYWFDVGDINYADGDRNAGGIDDDVNGVLSWEANREALTDRTFRVYRTTGIPVAA